MENGPFIVDLPIENCDFPWLCDSLPEAISTSWLYQPMMTRYDLYCAGVFEQKIVVRP